MKAITAKQARKINDRNGMETEENDGRKTYWATNESETETYSFESKAERDLFVGGRNNVQEIH